MEYLANISEPQVLPNEQIQFSICLFRFQWEKSNFSHWNLNKQMENWICWCFCSFGRTWGSVISARFSIYWSSATHGRNIRELSFLIYPTGHHIVFYLKEKRTILILTETLPMLWKFSELILLLITLNSS